MNVVCASALNQSSNEKCTFLDCAQALSAIRQIENRERDSRMRARHTSFTSLECKLQRMEYCVCHILWSA